MLNVSHLIYPLRQNQDLLQRQLRKCKPGSKSGQIIVEIIGTLHRAEKIAREMTPFDPSGL